MNLISKSSFLFVKNYFVVRLNCTSHYAFWATIPLLAMWILARLLRFRNDYREPHKATVFSARAFANLFPTQPWKRIKIWQDGRYQCALCEKA